MEFGREFGVPLDLAAMTQQTYVAAKAAYGGEAQSPMIAKLLEDLLGTDLRAAGLSGAAGIVPLRRMASRIGRKPVAGCGTP